MWAISLNSNSSVCDISRHGNLLHDFFTQQHKVLLSKWLTTQRGSGATLAFLEARCPSHVSQTKWKTFSISSGCRGHHQNWSTHRRNLDAVWRRPTFLSSTVKVQLLTPTKAMSLIGWRKRQLVSGSLTKRSAEAAQLWQTAASKTHTKMESCNYVG